jgi:rod shape-determining protein MreC
MPAVKAYLSKHRTGSLLAGYLLISIVLLGISSDSLNLNPKKAGTAVFSVVQRGAAGVGRFFGRMVNSIGELRRLQDNYSALQDNMDQYRLNERAVVQLRQENEQLREQLNFGKTIAQKFIAAEVVGTDAGDFLTGYLLNKGSIHGIKKNMAVVAFFAGFEGLVGRIIFTGPVSSVVLPLFDVTCYVPGKIQSSRYTGLISGQGDRLSNLLMTSVPKSARDGLKVGDLVISSGLSSIYPKNIYIGRIREIGARPWETSLQIEIEPIVDYSRLEYVFVLEGEEE